MSTPEPVDWPKMLKGNTLPCCPVNGKVYCTGPDTPCRLNCGCRCSREVAQQVGRQCPVCRGHMDISRKPYKVDCQMLAILGFMRDVAPGKIVDSSAIRDSHSREAVHGAFDARLVQEGDRAERPVHVRVHEANLSNVEGVNEAVKFVSHSFIAAQASFIVQRPLKFAWHHSPTTTAAWLVHDQFGATLRQHVHERGRLSSPADLGWVMYWLSHACTEVLREKRLLITYLTPDNLALTHRCVRILDLREAGMAPSVDEMARPAHAADPLAALFYCSPESTVHNQQLQQQLENEGDAVQSAGNLTLVREPQAVYALGAVLHFLATGTDPYGGDVSVLRSALQAAEDGVAQDMEMGGTLAMREGDVQGAADVRCRMAHLVQRMVQIDYQLRPGMQEVRRTARELLDESVKFFPLTLGPEDGDTLQQHMELNPGEVAVNEDPSLEFGLGPVATEFDVGGVEDGGVQYSRDLMEHIAASKAAHPVAHEEERALKKGLDSMDKGIAMMHLQISPEDDEFGMSAAASWEV